MEVIRDPMIIMTLKGCTRIKSLFYSDFMVFGETEALHMFHKFKFVQESSVNLL